MTREDVLWVSFKVLGLYFIVQGLTSMGGFAMALVSGMPFGGMGGMVTLSGLLPVAVGGYLLVDGRAMLQLATGRRATRGAAG